MRAPVALFWDVPTGKILRRFRGHEGVCPTHTPLAISIIFPRTNANARPVLSHAKMTQNASPPLGLERLSAMPRSLLAKMCVGPQKINAVAFNKDCSTLVTGALHLPCACVRGVVIVPLLLVMRCLAIVMWC